ncbi:neuropeptide F receptor-like [Mytilus edulis]|uniref:neuropeptide F receptor-like n=1 Tax=Mytilus edulis TaxID=6550 RepID=UPI0039EF7F92
MSLLQRTNMLKNAFQDKENRINDSVKEKIFQEFRNEDHWFDPTTETYLIIFYCAVIFIGTFSNVVICFIVWKNNSLRKPRNIFIVNIAVCDIIMCTFCMPFSLVKLTMKNWHLGLFLCKVVPSLQNIDIFVSTFTIVAIALDRYWAIVHASRNIHMRTVLYMLIFIWALALFCCIPMILFHEVHIVYGETANQEDFQICMEVWPSDYLKIVYTLFVTVVQYLMPLLIVSIIHSKICCVLRMRVTKDPTTDNEMQRALRDVKRHRRNMLLLTAIAITFGITWLPWTVLNITADINVEIFLHKKFLLIYAICLLIAMSSACANPVLYGWFNLNFRDAFTNSLFFWRKDSTNSLEMVTFNKTSNERKS